MASSYKDINNCDYFVILDGDKRSLSKSKSNDFIKALENCKDKDEATKWFNNRITFLPGKCWPEKWLIETTRDYCLDDAAKQFKIDKEQLKDLLNEALRANKHNEISELAFKLNLDYESVKSTIANLITIVRADDFEEINTKIKALLN